MAHFRSFRSVPLRSLVWVACLVLLAAIVPADAIFATTDVEYDVFMPIFSVPAGKLYGTVTENGVPAPGIPIKLYMREYDEANNQYRWLTVGSLLTSANGEYAFYGHRTIDHGEYYMAEFRNTTNGSRLLSWTTRQYWDYVEGEVFHLGDIDIANPALLAPPAGTAFTVPVTFEWYARPIPSDRYFWFMFGHPDYGPGYGVTNISGGSYTLGGYPYPDFKNNTYYWWTADIGFPAATDAYGINFWVRAICLISCPRTSAAVEELILRPRTAFLGELPADQPLGPVVRQTLPPLEVTAP